MARKVFFSFHYKPDNWRASQVRNMGVIEGNEPCSDNDWESVASAGEQAIENWIAGQIKDRTCAVVLVGTETWQRKWVIHEIKECWNSGMGVVGIRIHGLKDRTGQQCSAGANPFDQLHFVQKPTKLLSSVATLHDTPYSTSTYVYSDIQDNLEKLIEDAISIRNNFDVNS